MRLATLVGLTLHVALVVAQPVLGQDATVLSDAVTDEVGALASEEASVQAALDSVRQRDNVQLFALTTETTGGAPVTDFADDVAAANSLGGNDALLVIALADRSYALWVSDALHGVTDTDIDRIIDAVEPRLSAGDYAGGVIAAAEGSWRSGSGTGW